MKNSKKSDPAAREYRSYLLRIWHAEAPAHGWRASLEDLRTSDRLGFESLEHLFAFLMYQAEDDAKGGKTEQ